MNHYFYLFHQSLLASDHFKSRSWYKWLVNDAKMIILGVFVVVVVVAALIGVI